MWNVVSVDGHFEAADAEDTAWFERATDAEFERLSVDHLRAAGALVLGRTTYEGFADYWPTATGEIADLMNALPRVVGSRSLETASWANTTVVRDAVAEVAALKQGGDGDLLVLGSGTLSRSLTRAGLFDEYRLAVAPVVLGHGRPLFGAEAAGISLDLIGSRQLSSGCVVVRYAVRSQPSPR